MSVADQNCTMTHITAELEPSKDLIPLTALKLARNANRKAKFQSPPRLKNYVNLTFVNT